MTNYTASDFAKAEFARHPDGRVAARTAVDWAQWAFKCSECATDEERNECDGHDFGPDGYMANSGWVPVQEQAGSYTRTDEEDWQARAEKAEKERDEVRANAYNWEATAEEWEKRALAAESRTLRPDDATDAQIAAAYRAGRFALADWLAGRTDRIAEEMNR